MRGFPRTAFLLLGLAVLLRCVWLWDAATHSPYHGLLLLDAAVYDDLARRWAAGQPFLQEVFPLPPLYPALLAALYRVAGPSPIAVAVAQSCLGIAALALTYGIGRRVFGPRPALIALALGVLHGPLAFHETKMLSATLGLVLGLSTLALLLAAFPSPPSRPRTAARAALAGALLGLTALVRPEVLLFAPPAAGWLWWRSGIDGPARRALAAPAAFAVGLVLLLAPVAVRNARAAGSWSLTTLVSSQGGITFYQGNNERAAGLYVSLAREGFSGEILPQAAEERRIAEERLGRPLSRAEVSRYWFGRGLEWIRSDPAGFAVLLGRKLVRAFGSCEYSTEYVFALERGFARSLWLMPVPFALIGGCGLMGVGLLARERRLSGGGAVLLLAWALANLAAVLAFYVSTRYRLAATPIWMLFAGCALDRLLTAIAPALDTPVEGGLRARLARIPGRARVALLVGAALVAALHPPIDERHRAQEANAHHNIAVLRQRAGDAAAAVVAYDRALQIAPDHSRAWYGLGTALEETGRRDAAAHAYRMALRRNPSLTAARQRLRALGETTPPP